MLLLLGIIENHTSLQWKRSYQGTGSFEAHFPITAENAQLLKRKNLITFKGAVEAGVIESVEIFESPERMEFKIKGRFLEGYLDRRVVQGKVNFSGTVEDGMRQIISGMTQFANLQLGARQGYEETVRFQATYKNVLQTIQKLAKCSSLGYRIRPDFVARTMSFEVYRGNDHSITQTVNPHVEFSERYNNVQKFVYQENDQLYKNVAYVAGEGSGSSRTIIQTGDTASAGFNRYELFVDARDLQSDDLTTSQYLEVLAERGNERLSEAVLAKSVECVVDTKNFAYKTDYDIGDIVSVIRKPYGITESFRITELTEVYESGKIEINPVFGTPLPTKVDWGEDVYQDGESGEGGIPAPASPSAGQFLVYDGTNWVAQTVATWNGGSY